MTVTKIMTKKVFLDFIDILVEKDEVIIFSNRLANVKVLSQKKKCYAKSYTVIYPNDCFKNTDSISDLINSKLTGIIICPSKFLNDKLQKEFKEIKKNG